MRDKDSVFLLRKSGRGRTDALFIWYKLRSYTSDFLKLHQCVCAFVFPSVKLNRPPCCTSQIILPGHGAQLCLSVLDFHFLHCGTPPVTLYLILLYLHLFFSHSMSLSVWFSLLQRFFFLPTCSFSPISLILSHPSWHFFSICHFLSHPQTPCPPYVLQRTSVCARTCECVSVDTIQWRNYSLRSSY